MSEDKWNLYDFLKASFSESEYKKVPDLYKEKEKFLFLRTMSIMHPVESFRMQLLGIPKTRYIIDWWAEKLAKNYNGRVPDWIYKLGKKKAKTEEEKKKYIPDAELISYICSMNKWSIKDFNFWKSICEDDEFEIECKKINESLVEKHIYTESKIKKTKNN